MSRRIFTRCTAGTLLIVTFLLGLQLWLIESPVRNISCFGHLSLFQGDSALRLSSTLRIHGDHGSLYLNGTLYQDANLIGVINRSIDFIADNINNTQVWTSTSVNSAPEEKIFNALLTDWLASFYLYPGKKMSVSLERINLDSILLSDELTPYFLCTQ